MDDPSLVLLLLCLFRNYEEKDGNGNQLHLQLPQLFFFRWLHAQSLLSVAHLELVVAAFLRNASIGQVNLNSISEVTGASTSRLHDAEEEDETAEWVLERRLLEPLASEIFTLSFVTFIHSLFLI